MVRAPTLHLVSISESSVDWERTDRYAQATRARQYAATQGEADFDTLEHRRGARAARRGDDEGSGAAAGARDRGRRMLSAWPAAHHGYRASDVAQLSALLDEAVGELRVAAGLPRLDLTLVATASPLPPDVPELPPPTLRESIEQAFTAASVVAGSEPNAYRCSESIVGGLGRSDDETAGKADQRAGRRRFTLAPRPRSCWSSRPTRVTATS